MEPVRVGLLGLGTVGSGVARLLHEGASRIARRAGRPIVVQSALVRDAGRNRTVPLLAGAITTDPGRILNDSTLSIVVETIGGTATARRLVLDALAAGKHVVTANKALLAEHGPEIAAAARQAGRAVAFEASVGGGIPIIQALTVGLAANRILALSAILNGTCNFILTAMTRDGVSYAAALAEAQRLGYAEPDPTLDVDGTDTAHKLAVLAQVAFGAVVRLAEIPREGIDRLQTADIRYAGELGYTVKLLAHARASDAGLELRVAPRLVRRGTPLAEVNGAYNAIRVVGDAAGDTLFYGRGAGAMPTASAVVADLIDVAVGRADRTAVTAGFWAADVPPVPLATPEQVSSRYYLRFQIADRPGVLGAIAQVLGRHGVSIASVIQHDPGDDEPGTLVPLVIMTHAAVEARMTVALGEIDRLAEVAPPSVCLGVEDSL
jgi:homoserine dehydrogenase